MSQVTRPDTARNFTNGRWSRLLRDREDLLPPTVGLCVALKQSLVAAMRLHALLEKTGDGSYDLEQARMELEELCEQLQLDFARSMTKLPAGVKASVSL